MKCINKLHPRKVFPDKPWIGLLPLVVFLLFFACIGTVNAQGFLRVDGKRIVNEKGENVLLRGMGLGGWMLQEGYMLRVNREGQQHKIRQRIDSLVGTKRTQEFYDAWLANHTRKIDIDSMRAWGFNSVRLPMHYNLYTLPIEQEPVAGQNTWLEKGFAMTDSLLAWCRANKMYLILDLHAAPGGQGNDLNISDGDTSKPTLWESEANKQKMIALWRKLAARYVNEPWIGAYDIINEPNWGFADPLKDKNGTQEKGNAPLKQLLEDVTKAIREVDKKHIVIIEGNGWGNNYSGILPPWDNNMVLSFHKYWNKNDLASIQHILKAREQYSIPVWLGETGENSNVWFTEAIRLLESNNIGWAWWPLKKMGFNNPLEIKSNEAYNQILNYWSGMAGKPEPDNSYRGLMQLANSTRLENSIYHKDVIDAMMRQPFSAEAKPFRHHKIAASITIAAVDYDLGRNGVAYFDMDTADYRVSGQRGAGNKGRIYRNDGVDIRKDSTTNDGYFVSDIEKGEWLQYTVQVAKKGKYTISLQLASDTAGGRLSVLVNGNVVAKEVAVPQTGDTKNWQVQSIKNISLNAGTLVIRIYADAGSFNLKTIAFTKEQ
ncbi:MAG: glycosyl hydrolase family 5 [Flavisolibacter sp.]|nr:glycosyl hydrolase family 5 [Flavisolibacter sp.]